MREIEFRAKAINRDPNREYRTNYKNGDWVYGLIEKLPFYNENGEKFFEKDCAHMRNIGGVSDIDVDENTICEYIGLKDKNGNEIFEGDIFEVEDEGYFVIQWSGAGYFELQFYGYYEKCLDGNAYETVWDKLDCEPIWNWDIEKMVIKGNIFDNPNLIKGEE